MTKRREQTIELAEALGLEPEAGEPTSDLMDRCIEHASRRGGRAEAQRTEAPSRKRKGDRHAA